mgnify:CR=1 FL=1
MKYVALFILMMFLTWVIVDGGARMILLLGGYGF